MKSVKAQVENLMKDQVQSHANLVISYDVRLEFLKNSRRIIDQVWIETSKKVWRKVWYDCN